MMCSNGIPGIESLGGEVCCPAGCSQCGGSGCATAGLPDLGADECCAVEIFVSGWVCSITTVAPCIIDGTCDGDATRREAVAAGKYIFHR